MNEETLPISAPPGIPETPVPPVAPAAPEPPTPKKKRTRKPRIKKSVLPTDKPVTPEPSTSEKITNLLRATNARYDTIDSKVYSDRIERMTLNDLQDEAMRCGLKPNVTMDTRNVCLDTLMNLFYENKRAAMPDESGFNQTNISDEKRTKLLDLMKDAR